MAEFFLEIFSEEIPARMQAAAAGQLEGICAQVLKPLGFKLTEIFYGPRRLALAAEILSGVAASRLSERGPRLTAPEQALAGFLRKHGAETTDLIQEGDFWVLNKIVPGQSAAAFIQSVLPEALIKLPWPKSMRWGASGDFTWVRPLRRVTCLLDGAVVPFTMGPVASSDETEGHRVHGPGPFVVSSAQVWEEKLREHYVVASQAERREKISAGMAALAAAENLSVAPDEGLLDEVTGLVEWPVPLLGRIDAAFMDLPPEVRELSMKINQKYFALRDAEGRPAPYFAFVANLAAEDEGRAIIAGNERVLRARLADARHFWDLDLKSNLNAMSAKLDRVIFHAQIGTQSKRATEIGDLSSRIAGDLHGNLEEVSWALNAGALSKADLASAMVGEFPELQGIMGGYYATAHPDRWDGGAIPEISRAIRTHYLPKGPSDPVPQGIVPCAVALADKLYSLREFFRIGEKPTGSSDPYALRRAALGIIRIVLENRLRLNLKSLIKGNDDRFVPVVDELFNFIIERLRVKLRGEGRRFDILDAVLAAGADDDLVRLMKRVDALTDMLGTEDGKNLLAAFKRAANILKIEESKAGEKYDGDVDEAELPETEEWNLNNRLRHAPYVQQALNHEDFSLAMRHLSEFRPFIDAFFEKVTVNAPEPNLRLNRLRLLSRFVGAVQQVADFTKIEG